MSFLIYDLIFMIIFIIAITIFLRKNRHNLKRQGWIYLYSSKKGISFMKLFAKKYERILKPLQYVVVACGYLLMVGIVWLLGTTLYRYITIPEIVDVIKAPPIAPLIPYFPTLFGLESFFPPLYFTYFIIALAIVAVVHEFSHGIFAKLNNVRIKTTGFAFFGPILGAFVEQDQNQMNKAKKFSQLAILAAGTFANIISVIIFGIILGIFFMISFSPAGINFNGYPPALINLSSIDSVENISVENVDEILNILENSQNENEFIVLGIGQEKYYAGSSAIQKVIVKRDVEKILVLQDGPAIRAGLNAPILSIDGITINNQNKLVETLSNYQSGDTIIVETKQNGERIFHEIVLEEKDGKAYLGIMMFYPSGIKGMYFNFIANSKNTGKIYYESRGGDILWFFYYLLWWIVLINLLVALFNMLPLGILDGGRFFYLTIWGITKNEKVGRYAYKFATGIIIAIFVAMMFAWLIGIL